MPLLERWNDNSMSSCALLTEDFYDDLIFLRSVMKA